MQKHTASDQKLEVDSCLQFMLNITIDNDDIKISCDDISVNTDIITSEKQTDEKQTDLPYLWSLQIC